VPDAPVLARVAGNKDTLEFLCRGAALHLSAAVSSSTVYTVRDVMTEHKLNIAQA